MAPANDRFRVAIRAVALLAIVMGAATCHSLELQRLRCSANGRCPDGYSCGDDGYCHYPCANVNECKLIDNRFDYCDAGICKTEKEVNPECTLENPCPVGEDCISNECL